MEPLTLSSSCPFSGVARSAFQQSVHQPSAIVFAVRGYRPTSFKVRKFWNYCDVLRDDGMSYGDYVERLTHLVFLKRSATGRRGIILKTDGTEIMRGGRPA
ncbi:MAG: hypothetical protein C4293_09830 [Nitrospiraceae bacterium]